MTFTMYSNVFSLMILIILLIPVILLGLIKKQMKVFGMLISIPVLCGLMGFSSLHFLQFFMFLFYVIILLKWYIKHQKFYKIIFALLIMPLFCVKLSEKMPISAGMHKAIGFIGISYVSFRVWQIMFEAHDGKIKNASFLELFYFITFFPSITAGPIDRFGRFREEMNKKISRDEYINDYLVPGLEKIMLGVAYKFAIAAFIKLYFLDKIPFTHNINDILAYMYLYTLYLFFDFAGYSNFAVGTSYLLAIKSPENFNKPFLACNMKEFWERWHISLSKWFNDYVFSRFVLNTLRSKKIKNKKFVVRFGFLLTMVLMGAWHGFYRCYLIYGVYQGLMLIITDIYIKTNFFKRFKSKKYYNLLSRVICFNFIAFGMLIFSGYLFK